MTLLGLAGHSVRVSDIGPSDVAARVGLETIIYSRRLSITHYTLVCWTVAAHHSFTDN